MEPALPLNLGMFSGNCGSSLIHEDQKIFLTTLMSTDDFVLRSSSAPVGAISPDLSLFILPPVTERQDNEIDWWRGQQQRDDREQSSLQ